MQDQPGFRIRRPRVSSAANRGKAAAHGNLVSIATFDETGRLRGIGCGVCGEPASYWIVVRLARRSVFARTEEPPAWAEGRPAGFVTSSTKAYDLFNQHGRPRQQHRLYQEASSHDRPMLEPWQAFCREASEARREDDVRREGVLPAGSDRPHPGRGGDSGRGTPACAAGARRGAISSHLDLPPPIPGRNRS